MKGDFLNLNLGILMQFSSAFLAVAYHVRANCKNSIINNTILKASSNSSHNRELWHAPGPHFSHLFVFITCHPLLILENQINLKMNDVERWLIVYQVTYFLY